MVLATILAVATLYGLSPLTPPGTHCPTQPVARATLPSQADADFVQCTCAEKQAAKTKGDRDNGTTPVPIASIPFGGLDLTLPILHPIPHRRDATTATLTPGDPAAPTPPPRLDLPRA